MEIIKSTDPQIGNHDNVCTIEPPIVHIILLELVSPCILTALPGDSTTIRVHIAATTHKRRKLLFHFLLCCNRHSMLIKASVQNRITVDISLLPAIQITNSIFNIVRRI